MTAAQNGGRSNDALAETVARFMPLPNELVGNILGFLDLGDLRAAAAVGRQFYDAAWRSGLYIQRLFFDISVPHMQAEIAVWTELVEHAISKDLRLALMLEFSQHDYESDALARACCVEMLLIVSNSLPVLLALSVDIPESMPHETRAFLEHPVPRLRSFSLGVMGDNLESVSVPRLTGLFSGYAPNLREVELHYALEDACALPGFANVTRLSAIDWNCSPSVSMSLHFPKLKHLYVLSMSDDPEIPPRSIDLSGVTLASLAFEDAHRGSPRVTRLLAGVGNKIPVFHHSFLSGTSMDWHAPLAWPDTLRGSINLRLRGPSNKLNMSVSPSDHAWRRSYIFKRFACAAPIPLGDMPGLSARLEYLRLDVAVLGSFLQCNATLSALHRVRVDVAAAVSLFKGAATRERRHVRCPALGVLALAAATENAGEVTLLLSDVVKLVSVLSLVDHPALELCAVNVDVPAGQLHLLTLDDVFSSVRYVRAMPRDAFDRAVWDDSDALAEERYSRQSLAR